MSYVPPALRRKQAVASQGEDQRSDNQFNSSPDTELRSLKDIQKHFWPNWTPEAPETVQRQENIPPVVHCAVNESNPPGNRPQDENASSTIRDLDTDVKKIHADTESDVETVGDEGAGSIDGKEEAQPVLEQVHPHNTLNSTEESPEQLKYILLFYDANPRWKSDQIIYAKSALNLLPVANSKGADNDADQVGKSLSTNIMVFEQTNSSRTIASSMFNFIGHFNLVKAEILEPHSPGLVKMQEQKWTRTDRNGRPRPINRNAEGWKKSLSQRWAVLKFEKDHESTKDLKAPQIGDSTQDAATKDGNATGRKSVNEILREMRLNDAT